TAERLIAVGNRQIYFAQRIMSQRRALHLIIDALELDARDFLGRQKRCIDWPVAVGHFLRKLLLSTPQRQLGPRLMTAAAGHLERHELPLALVRLAMYPLLDQRDDVAVVNVLLFVG